MARNQKDDGCAKHRIPKNKSKPRDLSSASVSNAEAGSPENEEQLRADSLRRRICADISMLESLGLSPSLFKTSHPSSESPFKCEYPRKISKEIIRELPIVKYAGTPSIIDNADAALSAIGEIMSEKLLGFDTETRPNFGGNSRHHTVSILQLAGSQKVWIFKLHLLLDILPEIYKIFEAENIKKVGVAVHGDIVSLKEHLDFTPRGFIDIADYTQLVGVVNTGLRNLTALFFGERLSKAAQLSNWENNPLEPRQVEYAATDAWISRRLFIEVLKSLNMSRHVLAPIPLPEKRKLTFKIILRGVRNAIKRIVHPADTVKFVLSKNGRTGIFKKFFANNAPQKKRRRSHRREKNGKNGRHGY